jgi:hypothetical protein|uniref:Uncharacterized protein n=1 Tax=Podoviridae sp. ctc5632 TaxID=2826565 RepID=A0A8S5LVU8_9CAUD|nr:MAG TPA: hypothetical protein [Podoviridae sp. ctc5632]
MTKIEKIDEIRSALDYSFWYGGNVPEAFRPAEKKFQECVEKQYDTMFPWDRSEIVRKYAGEIFSIMAADKAMEAPHA